MQSDKCMIIIRFHVKRKKSTSILLINIDLLKYGCLF